MEVNVFPTERNANQAAADALAAALLAHGVRAVVLAAGNSPLELYRQIGQRSLRLDHIHLFALDEYVSVPPDDPRTCANLLRHVAAQAWGIPAERFHAVSSRAEDALGSIEAHERLLSQLGGIHIAVLGLGRNGHLGFNEPGSTGDSPSRVVDLEQTSIEANARWFGGEYAPAQGVTLGMRTILAAKQILILAFGKAKADAVFDMMSSPPNATCPASWVQHHPQVHVFLDEEAASRLDTRFSGLGVAGVESSKPRIITHYRGFEDSTPATPRPKPDPEIRDPKLGRLPTPGYEVCTIGLDLGGTKLAGGLVRFPEGELISRYVMPTHASRGPEAVLADASALVRRLAEEAGSAGRRVAGVGIGVPELVDLAGQVTSGQTIDWRGIAVSEHLGFSGPVQVEADVRAAALAEALFGAGRPYRLFVYVTIGTGISCTFVQDGQPYPGARGNALVLASSPWSTICDHCGNWVHPILEEIASGPALVRRYNAVQKTRVTNAEEVLAAARVGDTEAVRVVQSAGDAIGNALGFLANILDPEAIVVGGGLGLAGGLYWEALLGSTRRHIWAEDTRRLTIVPAKCGPDAGIIGAAATVWLDAADRTKQPAIPASKSVRLS